MRESIRGSFFRQGIFLLPKTSDDRKAKARFEKHWQGCRLHGHDRRRLCPCQGHFESSFEKNGAERSCKSESAARESAIRLTNQVLQDPLEKYQKRFFVALILYVSG